MNSYKNKNIQQDIINFEKELESMNKSKFSTKNLYKYLPLFFEYNKLTAVSDDTMFNKDKHHILNDLKKRIEVFIKKEIDKNFKIHNFSEIKELIYIAVQIDIKNIQLIDYISDTLIKSKLYAESIELYKTMFIHFQKPEYMEKIGDIYLKSNNIESAIDTYLNAVEISDDNIGAYQKLEKLFRKIGDTQSQEICKQQIKVIRGTKCQ